jgi:hypothetical protein
LKLCRLKSCPYFTYTEGINYEVVINDSVECRETKEKWYTPYVLNVDKRKKNGVVFTLLVHNYFYKFNMTLILL